MQLCCTFLLGEDIETVFKFTLTVIIFHVPFTYFIPLLLPMSYKHLNFPLMQCEMNLEPMLCNAQKTAPLSDTGALVFSSCSSTR